MDGDLNKLQGIFGKVTAIDASYEVRSTAKHYPTFIKVFEPNIPYMKSDPFVEDAYYGDGKPIVSSKSAGVDNTSNEDNLERSLRKTRTLITDYVLCNEFDLFATFTFSPKKTSDRYNPKIVKLQMANWLKNQKTRNGKFAYLIVPEFHADRKALHFHALFKNYAGKLISSGKKSKGRLVFYFKSYTLGINSAVRIDNPEKVSYYIRKYITKDMPQFRGKHRFWATTGLLRPRIEDNPNFETLGAPQRIFENEYGRILYFANSLTEDSSAPLLKDEEA